MKDLRLRYLPNTFLAQRLQKTLDILKIDNILETRHPFPKKSLLISGLELGSGMPIDKTHPDTIIVKLVVAVSWS